MDAYIGNLEQRLHEEFRSIRDMLTDMHNDISACKYKLENLNERLCLIEKYFAQCLPPAKPKKGSPGQPPIGQSFIPMGYYVPK